MNILSQFSNHSKHKTDTCSKLSGKQVIVAGIYFSALLFATSCKKGDNGNTNDKPEPNGQISNCKEMPASISYGLTTFDIKYNAQGKPIQITNNRLINPGSGAPAPPTYIYSLEYNNVGQLIKMSRSQNGIKEHYYIFDYNSNMQVIKETDFDAQNLIQRITTAEYRNGYLIKLITQTPGSTQFSTASFEYSAGNLTKKTVKNIYDTESMEYFDADFNYEYYDDQDQVERSLFSGLIGSRLIADYTGNSTLYYISDASKPRLLFSGETSDTKNRLKSVLISAHHFVSDETSIIYNYEYDNVGMATTVLGESKRTIVQSKPSPFGVPAIVETPFNTTFSTTIDYFCD